MGPTHPLRGPICGSPICRAVVWLTYVQACAAIYCEEKNCYEILGLESPMAFSTPATETEIKKAYRKLSLKWHPDKCKEDAKVCEANFIEVANAYTILSSKEQRKNYDYFLEHPEAYGHSARYYKTMMAPEVPFWVVVVGFVAIVSAIQWPLAWQQYRWAQKWAKQSETYKVRAAKMLEAQGMDETAAGVDDGVELELTGYPKPKWQDLFVFQLPLLPLRLLRPVYRAGRWIVKYNILGHPYDLDAQIYLAQEALRIPLSQWNHAPQEKRDEWVAAKPWTKKGMKELMRSSRLEYNQKKKRR